MITCVAILCFLQFYLEMGVGNLGQVFQECTLVLFMALPCSLVLIVIYAVSSNVTITLMLHLRMLIKHRIDCIHMNM